MSLIPAPLLYTLRRGRIPAAIDFHDYKSLIFESLTFLGDFTGQFMSSKGHRPLSKATPFKFLPQKNHKCSLILIFICTI